MSVIYEDEYGKDWPFSPEELAGKVIIFYLALPILSAILELIGTLLQ